MRKAEALDVRVVSPIKYPTNCLITMSIQNFSFNSRQTHSFSFQRPNSAHSVFTASLFAVVCGAVILVRAYRVICGIYVCRAPAQLPQPYGNEWIFHNFARRSKCSICDEYLGNLPSPLLHMLVGLAVAVHEIVIR